jgi:S-(hydroxymethyl)glutathione dehydrogenase/alcohol dehydrogenase
LKTRAALFHAPGRPLEVVEVEVEEPGPRDVLVRMAAVGVCGSDLHVVKGEWPRPTPMILGHEGAGVVEEVGAEVESLRPGDAVVLSWAPSCRECAACRGGRPVTCTTLRGAIGKGTLLDGTTRVAAAGAPVYRMATVGCLAELVLLPEYSALPLAADVSVEQAALLGCAALTGVGAVLNAARLPAGASALVIGAGGVGQFVVQGARIAGASLVVCVDPVEGRREQALRLGATHAAAPADVDELLTAVAPAGVDFAFEAVGKTELQALALRWTRNGGATVLVGMPPTGAKLEVDPFDFTNREKTLTGTIAGSVEPALALPQLVEHVRAGRLELESLVGPVFPLEQVNEALEESLAGSPGRVLVRPG